MAQRIELSEDERWVLKMSADEAKALAAETGYDWTRIHAEATKKVKSGVRRLRAAQKAQGYSGLRLNDAEQILDRETLSTLHWLGRARLSCEAPPFVVYV